MKQHFLRIAKKIIPPIVMDFIKKYKNDLRPEFQTWEQALKESTESAYENTKLVELIFYKTKKYHDKLYTDITSVNNSEMQTLTALGITITFLDTLEKIIVIDFGGACGAHFFLAKKNFRMKKFDWRVVETPEMVKKAKSLESEELHFYTDIGTAMSNLDVVHLVHTSGTLQCISEPYNFLKELVNISANFMLCGRLGVTTELNSIITTHRHMMSINGPGLAPKDFKDEICIYPFQYPVKQKVENILSESYNIKFLANDISGRFSVGSHEIIGISYFCQNKNLI